MARTRGVHRGLAGEPRAVTTWASYAAESSSTFSSRAGRLLLAGRWPRRREDVSAASSGCRWALGERRRPGGGARVGEQVCVCVRMRGLVPAVCSSQSGHVATWRSCFCTSCVALPIDLAGARLRGAA